MTIPTQGTYGGAYGSSSIYLWQSDSMEISRGEDAAFWSSYYQAATMDFSSVRTGCFFSGSANASSSALWGANGVNTVRGLPIRCIAENSSL